MSEQLHRYVVHYTDASDNGCPTFQWRCRAYNTEHVEMKFFDSDNDNEWRILKIEREKEPSGPCGLAKHKTDVRL